MGVGLLRWQCYRRHQQNHNPAPCQCLSVLFFCGSGKKVEYAKPRSKWRGVSYGEIGLTTVAVTQDLPSGMPLVLSEKELIHLWNSILPEPGQPSAQLSKLIRLTEWKKNKHAVSRWYMIVYISLFVASYDTHKANVGWILIPHATEVKIKAMPQRLKWQRSLKFMG